MGHLDAELDSSRGALLTNDPLQIGCIRGGGEAELCRVAAAAELSDGKFIWDHSESLQMM
jgi:hypothetical protein